jgi:hypothetical protein
LEGFHQNRKFDRKKIYTSFLPTNLDGNRGEIFKVGVMEKSSLNEIRENRDEGTESEHSDHT